MTETHVLCTKVASARETPTGWIHRLDGVPVVLPPARPEAAKINAGAIMREFSAKSWPEKQTALARQLGVSLAALSALGCAWAVGYNSWAFPMRDALGNTIGIRLRDAGGHKWAVTGSRSGLFFAPARSARDVVITEGPTDAAAAIDLGLYPVGRPSCQSSPEQVVGALRRLGARRAIICADADAPGIDGAVRLQAELPCPSCIWLPPCKDLREFLRLGGTRAIFDSTIKSLVWTNPA